MWQRLLSILGTRVDGGCHGGLDRGSDGLPRIVIVGSPNVGKSLIFNRLTKAYVTVSNYPGTTVAVSRARGELDGMELEIIDTPGMYSLLPLSEDEQVARSALIREKPAVVLHVVAARNLARMLPFTLQLIEAGLPVILNINMVDEAEASGMEIDTEGLEQALGIPTVATVATSGRGIAELKREIKARCQRPC